MSKSSEDKELIKIWARIGCDIELDFELLKIDPGRALADAIEQKRFTPSLESVIEQEEIEQYHLEYEDIPSVDDDIVIYIPRGKSAKYYQ